MRESYFHYAGTRERRLAISETKCVNGVFCLDFFCFLFQTFACHDTIPSQSLPFEIGLNGVLVCYEPTGSGYE